MINRLGINSLNSRRDGNYFIIDNDETKLSTLGIHFERVNRSTPNNAIAKFHAYVKELDKYKKKSTTTRLTTSASPISLRITEPQIRSTLIIKVMQTEKKFTKLKNKMSSGQDGIPNVVRKWPRTFVPSFSDVV